MEYVSVATTPFTTKMDFTFSFIFSTFDLTVSRPNTILPSSNLPSHFHVPRSHTPSPLIR